MALCLELKREFRRYISLNSLQTFRKSFISGPATPSATQPEREAVKLEAKQEGRREADRGGRVVVVGQSGISWKVIAGGIVVLLVVVLAVVRSRS